ncbi:TRADD-N-associated membrane domain-containing protein [Amycolatopsis sp. cmx-4-68]|uniref:TRADD-N-associated membrane domain-containing protein n=1 Tax=Amycolatopsis sp. cmx-4-68 TaxID=2790938 RepID=UPI003979C7C4
MLSALERSGVVDDQGSNSPQGPQGRGAGSNPVENSINVYSSGNFIQAGEIGGEVHVHRLDGGPADKDDLARGRQSFLFDFYGQALRQSATTFRMSVIFMSIGAVIVLTGGALALMRLGSGSQGSVAILTALGGVIIGTCGGAFAVHANRARKHLTRQAEKMERDLQDDRKLEQTLRLIDQVEDPNLRDRLKSVTAMRVLDIGPDSESVTNHLLGTVNKKRPRISSEEG